MCELDSRVDSANIRVGDQCKYEPLLNAYMAYDISHFYSEYA